MVSAPIRRKQVAFARRRGMRAASGLQGVWCRAQLGELCIEATRE
jgi:hypothetical protein